MKHRLVLVLGLVMSLLVASTSMAAATTTLDIDAIAESVTAADIPTLIDGLATPIAVRDLPADFTDATYIDSTSRTEMKGATCVYDASSTTLQGAAAYELTVDPAAGDFTKACASINYLVYTEKELGADPLGDYREGLVTSLAAEPGTPDENGGVAEVDDITVAGSDAILFTYAITNGPKSATVQVLATVVGNVLVLTQIQTQGEAEITGDTLEPVSEALMEAAIVHLGEVADEAQ